MKILSKSNLDMLRLHHLRASVKAFRRWIGAAGRLSLKLDQHVVLRIQPVEDLRYECCAYYIVSRGRIPLF